MQSKFPQETSLSGQYIIMNVQLSILLHQALRTY